MGMKNGRMANIRYKKYLDGKYPVQEIYVCDLHMDEGAMICAVGGPLAAQYFGLNRFEKKSIDRSMTEYRIIFNKYTAKCVRAGLPWPDKLENSLQVVPSERVKRNVRHFRFI